MLLIIKGFEREVDIGNLLKRAAEEAFFSTPSCVSRGMSTLTEKIYEEIMSKHADLITVHYNAAVSLIDFIPGRLDEEVCTTLFLSH